ncbi:MAG: helix-turn-helix transcriptional regulator [Acidobacteria bacterium]|nr:helix-turn-helix transcriptional regulator [Acidobacteriota bacterium]MBV9068994.1 helix-turn-helix transcriptional regulator [Acidobacteriota bacterium]MBV9184210.1 helix-turn-helix transcriptional regulator [Acidobacteriota bacterium]
MNAPLLVREVERIAAERSWSRARLARELGIDATTLAHVRSGRDPISQALLIAIGAAFGGNTTVQQLILHYVLIEARQRSAKRPKGPTGAAFGLLPYRVRWRIRRWLTQLDGLDKPRRGLFLTGANAAHLSAAARFALHEATEQGRTCIVIRANDRISTSHAKAAVDANLLIIERVEFASESITQLLRARSDALRPMIVTSGIGREQLPDRHLVRVFRAWTETITVSPPRTPTARRHAA